MIFIVCLLRRSNAFSLIALMLAGYTGIYEECITVFSRKINLNCQILWVFLKMSNNWKCCPITDVLLRTSKLQLGAGEVVRIYVTTDFVTAAAFSRITPIQSTWVAPVVPEATCICCTVVSKVKNTYCSYDNNYLLELHSFTAGFCLYNWLE